jgi:hypothetical protein
MQTHVLKSLAPFACAAALCTAPFADLHASDPNTVFLDSDPNVYSVPLDIAASPSGVLYAVGPRWLELEDTWSPLENVVLRSLDRGATWETATAIALDSAEFVTAMTDRDGNLYVLSEGPVELWRSAAQDQGANLQKITTFSEVLPDFVVLSEAVRSLAIDAAGNVFVCGRRYVSATKPSARLSRWVVAKGTPTTGGGLSWSVVDDFVMDAKYDSSASGLAIRPSNDPGQASEVWVRGTVVTKSGTFVALRRSTQGGAPGSWQTVTTYAGDASRSRAWMSRLAVGTHGAVYDAGWQSVALTRKTSETRWTTWRLAPGASAIQVVDQVPAASRAEVGVVVDAAGQVYVNGWLSGVQGSVLRTSANGNAGEWGDYDLALGAGFYGMTLDDEGSLYLAGECYDAQSDQWLGCIRKLPAP